RASRSRRTRGHVRPSSAGALPFARATCRVGKGAGNAVPQTKVSRAPCPRGLAQLRIMTAWARRTIGFLLVEFSASAHSPSKTGVRRPYGPPYKTVHYVESKENRSLFRLWARGAPSLLSSVSLENRGGWRATRRMAWISPDRARECVAPGRARIAGLWA